MGNFGKLEVAFGESMRRWFKKHDVADYGSAIMADEESVFVRVIYRPVSRFAYFLFKPTYKNLQGDLRKQLKSDLSDYIGNRTLVVSARNERSTLADRAVAGRVEQGSEELGGEAMVAKRGGISGALLSCHLQDAKATRGGAHREPQAHRRGRAQVPAVTLELPEACFEPER